MSRKLTDLNIDDSEFLNDSLVDFYNSDSDPLDEAAEDTAETVDTADTFEDVNNDSIFDVVETEDDEDDESIIEEDNSFKDVSDDSKDNLDDYNTLAILALSLKQEDPDLIDFEIEKDIKPEVLITNLKTKLDKTKQDAINDVEEKYGEAARYLKLILEGAADSDVTSALSYNQIASLEITGDEDESQLEQIVKNWLILKGVPDADDLIEVYKDKGVLVDKAKESVEFHKNQEALFFDNWQKNRDLQIAESRKRQLEYEKAVKTKISTGTVKGLTITDKKRFEDSLFKPTEIVETIDESGNKRLHKVPLINVKMQEFQQDIEQQLALQLLILDNFDFSSLVDKAKRKVNNNLINTLNERTSAPNTSRKSSSTYFED